MPRRIYKPKSSSGGGVGQKPPREITVSKALSFLLRHGATTEGIEMDDAGFANVADVLRWKGLSTLHVTLDELRALVASNDKQRFVLEPNPQFDPLSPASASPQSPSTISSSLTTSDPRAWRIRASQGHSLKTVKSDKLLQTFDSSQPGFPPSGYVVHGTYNAAWAKILATGGLRPMSRRHIHFATDLPPPLPPLPSSPPSSTEAVTAADKPIREDTVLSGMRRDATVLVWVDLRASAEKGGVKWWRSENGVVLTEGVDGVLALDWIGWVERRGTGEVLWGRRPEGLILGTGTGKAGSSISTPASLADPVATDTAADLDTEMAERMEAMGISVNANANANADIFAGGNASGGGGRDAVVKDNWDD